MKLLRTVQKGFFEKKITGVIIPADWEIYGGDYKFALQASTGEDILINNHNRRFSLKKMLYSKVDIRGILSYNEWEDPIIIPQQIKLHKDSIEKTLDFPLPELLPNKNWENNYSSSWDLMNQEVS